MKNKETLEEAAKKYAIENSLIGYEKMPYKGFISGAKWQAERMYSSEEVCELLKKAFFDGCKSERQIKPREKCWEEWLEQFKK